jgi:hypothetical protein
VLVKIDRNISIESPLPAFTKGHKKMPDFLRRYYAAIEQQLRSEVSIINQLLGHPGLKGAGNEAILRDLIKRFIPKKYDVDTGVIIDRTGRQSKQCDVVIYDALSYPALLSLTSVHLFPVDIVYATIEIKTTLDSEKAQLALDNIRSIRELTLSAIPFAVAEPGGSPAEANDATQAVLNQMSFGSRVNVTWCNPTPPAGVVFGYHSNESFPTLKTWFDPQRQNIPYYLPKLVCCMSKGLLMFDTPLDGRDYRLSNGSPGERLQIHLSKEEPSDDQSYVLLRFLLNLLEMLSRRSLNTSLDFSEYLT